MFEQKRGPDAADNLLDNDSGVNQSFSKKLAATLLGLTLLSGCGPSTEEIIKSLPEATGHELKEYPERNVGTEVSVKGNVTLIEDKSYTEKKRYLRHVFNGTTRSVIPSTRTVTHTLLWYNLRSEEGDILVFSDRYLNDNTFVVAGKVRQADDGTVYLHAKHSMFYKAEGK